MPNLKEKSQKEFVRCFGAKPEFFVQAPGRVNLIGEHTDYNEGFVLPMAIQPHIAMAVRPSGNLDVRVYSLDFQETLKFNLQEFWKGPFTWGEYIKGTAWALQAAGHRLSGFEATLTGDIPIGAALSSSAALEIATSQAFSAVSSFTWDASVMARICQRAENDWVGMHCGIMDQLICATGQKGYALLIDCRTLETEVVPLPEEIQVMILDTTTRRKLVESAYGERREQCSAAAQWLRVISLRDLTPEAFDRRSQHMNALLKKRARHVVTENARVLAAVAAMKKGDMQTLGRLMDASHASLRDDFEVSGQELDLMVACARSIPGCLGARMTGAGFKGCAVALVRSGQAKNFQYRLAEDFKNATGLTPGIYACRPEAGANIQYG
jgi:galactokinase